MQRIYSENTPLFHTYNLGKVDAYPEHRQIPKVDLFAVTAFNRFNSLTIFTNSCTSDAWQLWIHLCKMLCITNIMFKRNFYSHLHMLHLYFVPGHVLMIFLNFNNELVDLKYSDMEHDSGNVFHMFVPKVLKLLCPNFVVFWIWMYRLCFLWVTFGE